MLMIFTKDEATHRNPDGYEGDGKESRDPDAEPRAHHNLYPRHTHFSHEAITVEQRRVYSIYYKVL